MAPVTTDDRVTNLESNYSRLADVSHETNRLVKLMNRTLIGYMDEDKNQYVDGFVQRVACIESVQEKCLRTKTRRWGKIFEMATSVIAGVVIAFILWKAGLK